MRRAAGTNRRSRRPRRRTGRPSPNARRSRSRSGRRRPGSSDRDRRPRGPPPPSRSSWSCRGCPPPRSTASPPSARRAPGRASTRGCRDAAPRPAPRSDRRSRSRRPRRRGRAPHVRRIVPDVDVGAQVPQLREPFRVLEVRPAHRDAAREQQLREVPHAGPADPDQVEAGHARRATARRASGCFPAAACTGAASRWRSVMCGRPPLPGTRTGPRRPASPTRSPARPWTPAVSGSSTRSSTVVAKTLGRELGVGHEHRGADALHLPRVRLLVVLGRVRIRHQDRRRRRRPRAPRSSSRPRAPRPDRRRRIRAPSDRGTARRRTRATPRALRRTRELRLAARTRDDQQLEVASFGEGRQGAPPRPDPGAARPGSRRSP